MRRHGGAGSHPRQSGEGYHCAREGLRGTDALTRELQDHVKKTTAPYKYPRIIEYVDELPKTIGGKIKRKLIRQTDGIQE